MHIGYTGVYWAGHYTFFYECFICLFNSGKFVRSYVAILIRIIIIIINNRISPIHWTIVPIVYHRWFRC